MTYRRRTTHKLGCDDDDCRTWVTYDTRASNKSYAVRKARQEGWSVHGGGFFCPEHNTKPTPECPECGSFLIDIGAYQTVGTCRECNAEVRYDP